MSDLKGFFGRWSRRKRAAEVERQSTDKPGALPLPVGERVGGRGARSFERPEPLTPPLSQREREHTASDDPASPRPPCTVDPVFDLTKLPPIESITAETDIRAFLAPGIPVELSRAALRRAWSADPRIREFVGLSENSWDFNAAGAIPGFGALEMTDEVRRHVARLLSPKVADDDPARSASLPHDRREQCTDVEESVHSQEQHTEPSSQPSVSLGRQMASPAPPSEGDPTRDLTVRFPTNSKPDEAGPPVSAAKRFHGRALPK